MLFSKWLSLLKRFILKLGRRCLIHLFKKGIHLIPEQFVQFPDNAFGIEGRMSEIILFKVNGCLTP